MDDRRHLAVVQAWLLALCVATGLLVETGNRRWENRFAHSFTAVKAYKQRNHSGEVVFLGSSAVGMGIIPGAVEEGLESRGIEAEAFVLYTFAATMPTYRTLITDLVLEHGKPHMIVLGLGPRDLNSNTPSIGLYGRDVGSFLDNMKLLAAAPVKRRELIWSAPHRIPSVVVSAPISLILPPYLESTLGRDGAFWNYSSADPEKAKRLNSKLLAMAKPLSQQEIYEERLRVVRDLVLRDYRIGDFRGWLVETVESLERREIPFAICLFSYSQRAAEDLQGGYYAETSALVQDLADRHGFPVWRTSTYIGAHDHLYRDGVDHLTPEAAQRLSRALGRGPVASSWEQPR